MKEKILFGLLAILLVLPLVHADITSDLRAWYQFENNLRDSTGFFNDGIAIGSISYSDGYIGKALHLNDTYSAVNIGNDTSLQIDGNMTFSAWIFPYMDTGGYIISKAVWYGDNGEYNIQYSSPIYDNYLYFGRNLDYKITSCPITANSWQLLTITTNETDTKFYINGSLIFEDTGLIASSNTTGNAWIGNFPPEGAYGLDILYDDMRLYNRTLTFDDVEELYTYIPVATTTTLSSSGASYSTCYDNSTLRVSFSTVLINGSETTNQTEIVDRFCDFGCVQTGTYTAECRISPLMNTIILIFVVILIIIILFIISRKF